MSERKFKHRSVRNATWETMPLVEGHITELGEHDDDGRKAPFVVVDTTVSLVRIYESKDLEELFKVAKVGDSVRIEFLEMVTLAGGKRFARFDSSIWTGDAPEPA